MLSTVGFVSVFGMYNKDTSMIVAEVKRQVSEAIKDEEDVYVALDSAQDALDELVSKHKRKGRHFRAWVVPGTRRERLEVHVLIPPDQKITVPFA